MSMTGVSTAAAATTAQAMRAAGAGGIRPGRARATGASATSCTQPSTSEAKPAGSPYARKNTKHTPAASPKAPLTMANGRAAAVRVSEFAVMPGTVAPAASRCHGTMSRDGRAV